VAITAANDRLWTMGLDRPSLTRITFESENARPVWSPDGRWIAYTSNESGRYDVYVRPFPGLGQKQLVSVDGGMEPRCRGDGREILLSSW
jgi:Tol biopolymer transport system component